MKVGLVGVGIMGSHLCANLVKAGFDVCAYDSAAPARARAAASGARVADDLAAVASDAQVILLSLPDPHAVASVVEGAGLLSRLAPGTCVCDTSTVDPGTARRLHALARDQGVGFLDCPVSGGPPGAEAGTLTIMVGGEADDLARAEPVLRAIGRRIVHCGASGTGQAAKLVNQALVAAHTVAALEALLVGVKAGLSLDTMMSILEASSGRSWMLENHMRSHVLAGEFEPGFALDLMFKDLRLFLVTATEVQSPALVASAALQLYNAARAAGHGGRDQTIVAKELERMAGAALGALSPQAGATPG